MRIVLWGYMGSGKSTVGLALAQKLGVQFIDLDNYIAAQESATIQSIFQLKGELYFRKAEEFYLKEIHAMDNKLVLSIGGGTPCFGNNLDLLKSTNNWVSIYLDTQATTLSFRLFNQRYTRPLISHCSSFEELNDFIKKHLFERSYYYNQADLKIQTDDKSVEEVVQEIAIQLF